MKDITDYWRITQKVHCGISDSANNIKRALRLNQWNHLACFAHTINLIVAASIDKDPELVELIQKIKKIVTFFHHSTKAMDRLHVNQNRLNLPNHKLIQQVDTRWNSVYYMLERYLEQHEAIRTTLCLLDKNEIIIPSDSNVILREAVQILAPFEAVTREISSEKYTSASKIIPISKGLQKLTLSHLVTMPRLLTQNLIADMRTRFLNMEENKLLASATLLDPRFKKLAFADKEAAERAIRIILSEISEQPPQPSNPSPNPSNHSSPPVSENLLWQFFDEQVSRVSAQRTSAYTELQQFLKAPVIRRSCDPLQWWKDNSHYPSLTESARRYLCTVATSVPAERLFSKAGELLSIRRSRIKPKHVDMFLFLNKNT